MKYIKVFFYALILMSFFILSKVDALTLKNGNILSNNISGYDNIKNGAYFKNNIDFSANFDFSFTINGNNNISGYDYISFNLYQFYLYDSTVNLQNGEYQPAENTEYYCTQWAMKQTTYADGSQSNYYVCEIWAPSSNSSTYTTTTYGEIDEVPEIGFSVYAIYQDNTYSNCEFDTKNYGSNLITCKISDTATNITSLRFRGVTSPYYAAITGQIGITSYYTAWKDPSSSSSSAIINNQNQNQQQSHQDMQDINNSINNTNVSGANTDANSFVNNQAFQDNTGLSSIVTSPLSVVNSLTNSCNPIRLTLPYIDTNVDIPCIGTLLEQKAGALIQLVKVVINGFICYIIGLDIFKIVKNARNPDDDRIEVLDL